MSERRGTEAGQPIDLWELDRHLRERRPIDVKEDGSITLVKDSSAQGVSEGGATRVRAHTWGVVVPQSREWRAEPHWYERKPGRLVTERDAMAQHFPGFRLVQHSSGTLAWIGKLRPVHTTYVVELRYPDEYPFRPPRGFVLEPELALGPHQFGGGEMCLIHDSGDVLRDREGRVAPTDTWVPSATVATIASVVSNWLGANECHMRRCRSDEGRPCTSNDCGYFPGFKHGYGGIVA